MGRIIVSLIGTALLLGCLAYGSKCPEQEAITHHVLCYYEGRTSLNEINLCNCTHIILTDVVEVAHNYSIQLIEGTKENLEIIDERKPSLIKIFTLEAKGNLKPNVFESESKSRQLVKGIENFLSENDFTGVELNIPLTVQDAVSKESVTSFFKLLKKELVNDSHERVKREGYDVFEKVQDDITTAAYRTQTFKNADKIHPVKKTISKRRKNQRYLENDEGSTRTEVRNGARVVVRRRRKELRTGGESEETKGLVFIRLPVNPELIGKKYDIKTLSRYSDLLIVSTHNITDDSESSLTYHPSRLMGLSDMLNADSILDFLTGLGVTKSKLVLTMPATVIQFQLENERKTTPRSPTTGQVQVIDHSELCSLFSRGNWTIERDEDLTAPYAFSEDKWLAYEDKISINIKAKYIILRELAGGAIYPIDADTGRDPCNETSQSMGFLTNTLYENMRSLDRKPRGLVLESLQQDIHDTSFSSAEAGVHLSEYRIVRVVDHSGAVHVIRKNAKTQFECSRQGYFSHPLGCNKFYRCVKFNQYTDDFTVFEYDCPAGLAFDERWEVCVWPGSLPHGAPCTGSSEIAPVPRAHYQCPNHEGYYADPENCRWFFACLDHARDGVTPLTAYEFRCPFGLVFNEQNLACDWPWNVGSCGNRGLSAVIVEHHGGSSGSLNSATYIKTATGGNLAAAGGFAAAGAAGSQQSGYIAGQFDDNQERASFGTVPDHEISGGRILNRGGLVLNQHVNVHSPGSLAIVQESSAPASQSEEKLLVSATPSPLLTTINHNIYKPQLSTPRPFSLVVPQINQEELSRGTAHVSASEGHSGDSLVFIGGINQAAISSAEFGQRLANFGQKIVTPAHADGVQSSNAQSFASGIVSADYSKLALAPDAPVQPVSLSTGSTFTHSSAASGAFNQNLVSGKAAAVHTFEQSKVTHSDGVSGVLTESGEFGARKGAFVHSSLAGTDYQGDFEAGKSSISTLNEAQKNTFIHSNPSEALTQSGHEFLGADFVSQSNVGSALSVKGGASTVFQPETQEKIAPATVVFGTKPESVLLQSGSPPAVGVFNTRAKSVVVQSVPQQPAAAAAVVFDNKPKSVVIQDQKEYVAPIPLVTTSTFSLRKKVPPQVAVSPSTSSFNLPSGSVQELSEGKIGLVKSVAQQTNILQPAVTTSAPALTVLDQSQDGKLGGPIVVDKFAQPLLPTSTPEFAAPIGNVVYEQSLDSAKSIVENTNLLVSTPAPVFDSDVVIDQSNQDHLTAFKSVEEQNQFAPVQISDGISSEDVKQSQGRFGGFVSAIMSAIRFPKFFRSEGSIQAPSSAVEESNQGLGRYVAAIKSAIQRPKFLQTEVATPSYAAPIGNVVLEESNHGGDLTVIKSQSQSVQPVVKSQIQAAVQIQESNQGLLGDDVTAVKSQNQFVQPVVTSQVQTVVQGQEFNQLVGDDLRVVKSQNQLAQPVPIQTIVENPGYVSLEQTNEGVVKLAGGPTSAPEILVPANGVAPVENIDVSNSVSAQNEFLVSAPAPAVIQEQKILHSAAPAVSTISESDHKLKQSVVLHESKASIPLGKDESLQEALVEIQKNGPLFNFIPTTTITPLGVDINQKKIVSPSLGLENNEQISQVVINQPTLFEKSEQIIPLAPVQDIQTSASIEVTTPSSYAEIPSHERTKVVPPSVAVKIAPRKQYFLSRNKPTPIPHTTSKPSVVIQPEEPISVQQEVISTPLLKEVIQPNINIVSNQNIYEEILDGNSKLEIEQPQSFFTRRPIVVTEGSRDAILDQILIQPKEQLSNVQLGQKTYPVVAKQKKPKTVYFENFERTNPALTALQQEAIQTVLPQQTLTLTTESPVIVTKIEEIPSVGDEIENYSNFEFQKIGKVGAQQTLFEAAGGVLDNKLINNGEVKYQLNSNIEIAPPPQEYLVELAPGTTPAPPTQSTTLNGLVTTAGGYSSLSSVDNYESNDGKSTVITVGQVDKEELDEDNVEELLQKYSGDFGNVLNRAEEKFVTKIVKGEEKGEITIGNDYNTGTVGYDVSTARPDVHIENSYEDSSDEGGAVALDLKNLKIKKNKKTIIVVSQVSDSNPLLIGKLAGQCSCQSNKIQLRRKSKKINGSQLSTTTYLPSLSDSLALETVSPQPSVTTEKVVLIDGSRQEPSTVVEVKAEKPEGFFVPVSADEIANTVEDLEIPPKAAGATFDRYSPREWRGFDESLQGGGVACVRPGLFRHPKHCNKFYACNYDPWKKRYMLHVFNCPIHLSYDSSITACNWPSKGPTCAHDNLLV